MKISLPILPVVFKIEKKKLDYKGKQFSFSLLSKYREKVFVIGINKTGTTTLKETLSSFGYQMGNQKRAEILGIEWGKYRDASNIIKYCFTADAFQDIPFSTPELYKLLDKEFPNAKFILSVRDSGEQWYDSLVKFHSKKFSSERNRIPTESDLSDSLYGYRGMVLDVKRYFYSFPEVDLYDKVKYIKFYYSHIKEVKKYFLERDKKLLTINVANEDDFYRLVSFLNVNTDLTKFPWKNKT
jgi:hypothetical protein